MKISRYSEARGGGVGHSGEGALAESRFGALLISLRDAGVSSKYAERLVAELDDHFADLESELLAANRTRAEAAEEAHARLGDAAVVAREIVRRPELRAWIYRSPWIVGSLSALLSVAVALLAPYRLLVLYRSVLLRYLAAGGAAVAVMSLVMFALQVAVRQPFPWPKPSPATASAKLSFAPPRAAGIHRVPVVRVETVPGALERAAKPTPPPMPDAPPQVEIGSEWVASAASLAPDIDDLAGAPSIGVIDGEYLAIVRPPPIYPPAAASRGIEGYVVVEYTITPAGTVENAHVVESSSDLFHQAALEAAHKFRYKPRIVSGRPVPVSGVRSKMTFLFEA